MSHPVKIDKQDKIFPVIDGHVDLLYMMMRQSPGISFCNLSNSSQPGKHQITPQTLKQGCVFIIISAFYCPDIYNGPETAALYLQKLIQYAGQYMEGLLPVTTSDELKTCCRKGESPGSIYLLENADSIVDADLLDFKKKGFTGVGLTHAGKNRIGDGNGIKFPSGLTTIGCQLVKQLDYHGFFIDVAHLSKPCFQDMIDIFKGPIISSHTGFRKFCDIPRNLSDEQLRVLIKRDAVIGVSVNPEMLGVDQSATVNDVFYQIDWFVQKYGVEHAALGSDFGGFDGVNQGLENHGQLGRLEKLFADHGYPDNAIAKIMGENWYRFYAARLA